MFQKFTDHPEWILSNYIFNKICEIWGNPETDLFGSQLDHNFIKSVSWQPGSKCFYFFKKLEKFILSSL